MGDPGCAALLGSTRYVLRPAATGGDVDLDAAVLVGGYQTVSDILEIV